MFVNKSENELLLMALIDTGVAFILLYCANAYDEYSIIRDTIGNLIVYENWHYVFTDCAINLQRM